jgi:hypothetical protein
MWQGIQGFEDLYEVSDDGQVRSLDRIVLYTRKDQRTVARKYRGKLLQPGLNSRGYEIVTLCDTDNRHHTRAVHRLVLETFDRFRISGEECRHLDGNIRNNHRNNLRWGTAAENMADKIAHGTWVRGSRVGGSRLTEDQVREIKARLAQKEPHCSIALDYGVKAVTISAISAGRNWAWV